MRTKRTMQNIVNLDGCAKALFGATNGTAYVPVGDLDKQVFQEQKKYKRGKARTIVMKHATSRDMYVIWKDLLIYYDDYHRISQLWSLHQLSRCSATSLRPPQRRRNMSMRMNGSAKIWRTLENPSPMLQNQRTSRRASGIRITSLQLH